MSRLRRHLLSTASHLAIHLHQVAWACARAKSAPQRKRRQPITTRPRKSERFPQMQPDKIEPFEKGGREEAPQ